MHIVFMRDNFTCVRLDDKPVDEAMDLLEALVEEQHGYGFVGTTQTHGPRDIVQWSKGEPWRQKVRALLWKHAAPIAEEG